MTRTHLFKRICWGQRTGSGSVLTIKSGRRSLITFFSECWDTGVHTNTQSMHTPSNTNTILKYWIRTKARNLSLLRTDFQFLTAHTECHLFVWLMILSCCWNSCFVQSRIIMLQIILTAGNNKFQLGPRSPFRMITLVSGFITALKNKLIDSVPGNASHSKYRAGIVFRWVKTWAIVFVHVRLYIKVEYISLSKKIIHSNSNYAIKAVELAPLLSLTEAGETEPSLREKELRILALVSVQTHRDQLHAPHF